MRILAVDVGATWLRVAMFEGEIMLSKRSARTPRSGGELAVANAIIELAGNFKPDAIGIGSIGPLDLRKGAVVNTPNNPLGSFELREPLRKMLGAPVYIANDCVAAAWGEYLLGAGKDKDLAYVTMSTGIGVGAVIDGRPLVGRRGNAHELGHVTIDYKSSLRCGCGGLGHWEALAGGANMKVFAKAFAESIATSSPAKEVALAGEMGTEELFSHARKGDPFALSLLEELSRIHAAGLSAVIAAYDPEAIFIGGSVFLNNEEVLLPRIKRHLASYSLFEPPAIRRASFGEDAVLYGALALALRPPAEIARFNE